MSAPITHESYVHRVRETAVALSALPNETKHALLHAKLVYGAGHGMGARGVTAFGAWQNGEPKPVELAVQQRVYARGSVEDVQK